MHVQAKKSACFLQQCDIFDFGPFTTLFTGQAIPINVLGVTTSRRVTRSISFLLLDRDICP